jgi:hypothetical protein
MTLGSNAIQTQAQMKMQKQNPFHRVLWLHIPNVESVAAVGEFNGWSTISDPLENIGNDLWELHLHIEIDPRKLCYFVWPRGACGGRLIHVAADGAKP